jgi:hypothetical protein
MGRTGVPRHELVRIAARPIVLLAPLAVVECVLSYFLMKSWMPWAELGVLLTVCAAYLAAALLIPAVRRDAAGVWDVARRLRR